MNVVKQRIDHSIWRQLRLFDREEDLFICHNNFISFQLLCLRKATLLSVSKFTYFNLSRFEREFFKEHDDI